ncbi:MAG: hypothetical protein IKJ93_05055 [Clostridia bacterium]|nr:hypothetical protein [Clostridia bacterium]
MKNKVLVTILYIIQAVPIPFSLISILGSIISLANIGTAEPTSKIIISFLAMFLSATYTITYFVSLVFTKTKNKIGFYSFLPFIHLFIAIVLVIIWSYS